MMMIDRKTALVSTSLIALMLVAAVVRIVVLDDWPRQANLDEALRLWQFFTFPFIAAMLVVSLYANGRRAIAVEAKVQPWYEWGRFLSIGVCLCLLAMQGLLVAISLGLQVPVLALVAAGSAILAAEVIIVMQAINQVPKLPWFERRFFPAGGARTGLRAKISAGHSQDLGHVPHRRHGLLLRAAKACVALHSPCLSIRSRWDQGPAAPLPPQIETGTVDATRLKR
jgi:hypothetical protein